MTDPISNLNHRSTLIIGPTGSGKTFLLATAYEYVWETFGKTSVHYMSDPGGYPDNLSALISSGIVRLVQMLSRGADLSFETAALCARGYMPAKVDPRTGIMPKGVRMIPPTTTTYVEICGSCGQEAGRSIAVVTLARGMCPHCKAPRGPLTAKIQQFQTLNRGFEQIGARGYDGLTSMSDWYLHDMAHRVDLGGEQAALGGKITSGDLSWQQNNRAQVGFAQARAHELVLYALEIPGMVIGPLWTAIANETNDEGGLPVVGPKLAGGAKTDIAPQWFGNCFEAALDVNELGRKVRRVYLSEFIDTRGRRHLLKHRGDARFVPEVLADEPYNADGTPPAELGTGFNLGRAFTILQESLKRTEAATAAKYPNAPGLDAVPAEYGMDVAQEPAQAQQTASPRPVVSAPRARATGKPRAAGAPATAPQPDTASPAAVSQPDTKPEESSAGTQAAPQAADAQPVPAAIVQQAAALPLPQQQLGTLPAALPVPGPAGPTVPKAPATAKPRPAARPVARPPAAGTPAQAAPVPAPAARAAQVEPQTPPVSAPPPAGTVGVPVGQWAPPPGAQLAPPRGPAGAPQARPVARPVARPAVPKPS